MAVDLGLYVSPRVEPLYQRLLYCLMHRQQPTGTLFNMVTATTRTPKVYNLGKKSGWYNRARPGKREFNATIVTVQKILALYNQGHSIRNIKKITGHARKTIRHILEIKVPPPFKTSSRPTKIDDYKNAIKENFDDGTFTSKQIYDEIKRNGYNGSYSTVNRYICELVMSSPSKKYFFSLLYCLYFLFYATSPLSYTYTEKTGDINSNAGDKALLFAKDIHLFFWELAYKQIVLNQATSHADRSPLRYSDSSTSSLCFTCFRSRNNWEC